MEKYKILNIINSPDDIKSLELDSLRKLSSEISDYIMRVVEKKGGHYSSPLGVVDLTIALHYVYNSPLDKLIWDVGHQSYAHKIITGRKEEFKNIRSKDGISGFLKRSESKHDIFGAGHASTSISAALGIAHARDKLGKDEQVVAIIGDGAMTGGLAYEGLNNLGYYRTQMTIVLNDNSHSISKSVGALSHYLTKILTNPTYNRIRNDIWDFSGKLPMSSYIRKFLRKTEEGIKGYFTPGAFFEDLGLRYIGPIDGHKIDELIHAFKAVKKMNTPVLLHIYTKKGKGNNKAENDAIKYYSMSKSENKVKSIDYSFAFGQSITELAENNKKIICVTAAMEIGTGISKFKEKFSSRYIDVGIAEEHAVTYAAGLASSSFRPVVPIYSTFMQRAYDNIFHDVLLQDLPIIFCMDRAGFVGPDGPTHHGLFDISFMSSLPNIIVSAPKSGDELRNLLFTALSQNKSFSIRYPKSDCINFTKNKIPELIEIGTWEVMQKGKFCSILAVGSMLDIVLNNRKIIQDSIGFIPTIINARFIKPIDKKIMDSICKENEILITLEEGALLGGFGSIIGNYLHDNKLSNKLIRLGVSDNFVEHGTREELLEISGLTVENLINKININTNNKKTYVT